MNNLSEILNLRLLALGRAVITPLSLGTAAIIIILSFAAARILGSVLSRMRERSKHGRAPLYIVQKVSTYGLTLFGLFVGASTLGLNLSSLAVVRGSDRRRGRPWSSGHRKRVRVRLGADLRQRVARRRLHRAGRRKSARQRN